MKENVAEGRKAFRRNFVLAWNYGGITSLKLSEDVFDTDYIWQGETLGEVVVRYRLDGGDWQEATTFASGDVRQVLASAPDGYAVAPVAH